MFVRGEGCKHTVFFALRTKGTQGKGHSGQRALRAKGRRAARSATRAFCTICAQRHAAHSLRASCLP